MQQARPMKRYIVIVSPPYSGKTTIARLLAAAMKIGHLDVGHIIRKMGLNLTSTSAKEVIQLLEQELASQSYADGAIIDGFPQNLEQAVLLDELLWGNEAQITDAIILELDADIAIWKAVLLKRAAGRQTCSVCGRVYGKSYTTTPVQQNICDDCSGLLVGAVRDRSSSVVQQQLEAYMKIAEELTRHYTNKGLFRSTTPDMSEIGNVSVAQSVELSSDILPAEAVELIVSGLPETYYVVHVVVRNRPPKLIRV